MTLLKSLEGVLCLRTTAFCAWVLLLGVLTMSLVGCEGKVASSTHPVAPVQTLTLWTLQMGSFSEVLRPSLQRFEATHPSVKVHWVDIPFQDADKKLVAAALAHRLPDVVNLNPDLARLLAEKDLLTPLSLKNDTLPVPLKQSVSWGITTETPSFDKGFAYPWYLTSQLSMVNTVTALRHSATGTPPCLPAWETSKPIHDASSEKRYWMIPSLSESGTLLKQLWLMGEHPFVRKRVGATSSESVSVLLPHIDSPMFLALLRAWYLVYHQGGIPPESLNTYKSYSASMFLQQRSHVLAAGSSFLNVLQANQPAMASSLQILPQWKPCLFQGFLRANALSDSVIRPRSQRYDFSPMVLAVPRATQYERHYGRPHPASTALIAHLTNTLEQRSLIQALPVLPVRRRLLEALAQGTQEPLAQVTQTPMHPAFEPLRKKASQQGAWQVLHTQESYPNVPQQAWLHQQVDILVQEALLSPSMAQFPTLIQHTQQRMLQKLQEDTLP